MKNRILIVVVLLLSFILGIRFESFAGQASAQATILIIIPPRQDDEKKAVEKDTKEVVSSEIKVADAKGEEKS